MALYGPSMNWLPRSSAYGEARNWSAKQKVHNTKAMNSTAALADELASNITSSTDNQATLAGEIAIGRIKQEAMAKRLAASQPEKPPNAYETVMKRFNSNQRMAPQNLASGGTLNLSSNTLRLSDGTNIDLTTGYKVPEYVSKNIMVLSDGTRINLKTGYKIIDIVS